MIEKLTEMARKSITYKDFEKAIYHLPMKKVLQKVQELGYPDLEEFYNENCNKNVYLTPREVADILKVSTHKLRADRMQGRGIPYYHLGESKHSEVRYKYRDVIDYIEQYRGQV